MPNITPTDVYLIKEAPSDFQRTNEFVINDEKGSVIKYLELKKDMVVMTVEEYEQGGWISVRDNLPKKDGNSSIFCLVNCTSDGVIVRPFNEYHNCWDTEDGDDYYSDAINGKITHWMLLPETPKK